MSVRCLLVILAAGLPTAAADPVSDPAAVELKKFEGDWKAVSGEQKGEKLPEGYLKTLTVTFKGDRVSVRPAEPGEPDQTIKLDPTKKPKQIDGGSEVKGIYDLDGDTLTIRLAFDGSDRPTGFAGKTKRDEILLVLKRVKP